jgi:hypothetical protein
LVRSAAVLDVFNLDDGEDVCSISLAEFAESNAPKYVVGTAYISPNDDEPKRGRILVFEVTEGALANGEIAMGDVCQSGGLAIALATYDGIARSGVIPHAKIWEKFRFSFQYKMNLAFSQISRVR